jgi:hypothetical protein
VVAASLTLAVWIKIVLLIKQHRKRNAKAICVSQMMSVYCKTTKIEHALMAIAQNISIVSTHLTHPISAAEGSHAKKMINADLTDVFLVFALMDHMAKRQGLK